MAFDVFISYSAEDKPIADAACAALEAAGVRCWIAPRDIVPGRDYGEAIIDAIEDAKIFVLILSAHANDSTQIKREVERAVSKGLTVVPVRIEDVAPSRNLEYFISAPHWLDAFPPPREKYFAKLVDSVHALLGTERSGSVKIPVAAQAPPQKAIWNGPPLRAMWIGGAVIALSLALIGGYLLYQSETQPLVRTLVGHGAEADSVSFSPDGMLIASGGYDAAIHIWTTADGQLQPPAISGFMGHTAPFSPDGKAVAGGASDNNVRIWDAASRRVIRTYSGPADKVLSVAFSKDNEWLAAGGKDKAVFTWQLAGNAPGRRLAGHTDSVYSVAFSTNNKLLASAGFDQKVIVWDVVNGVPMKTLNGSNKMMAATFSSDDGWLAAAGWDGNVTVWDTDSWQVVRVFPGNGQIVTSIAFSPDNKMLVSGGYDHTVKVWNAATGALIRTLSGHTETVWDVAFSPDGKTIASASGDKTVRIWRTPNR